MNDPRNQPDQTPATHCTPLGITVAAAVVLAAAAAAPAAVLAIPSVMLNGASFVNNPANGSNGGIWNALNPVPGVSTTGTAMTTNIATLTFVNANNAGVDEDTGLLYFHVDDSAGTGAVFDFQVRFELRYENLGDIGNPLRTASNNLSIRALANADRDDVNGQVNGFNEYVHLIITSINSISGPSIADSQFDAIRFARVDIGDTVNIFEMGNSGNSAGTFLAAAAANTTFNLTTMGLDAITIDPTVGGISLQGFSVSFAIGDDDDDDDTPGIPAPAALPGALTLLALASLRRKRSAA